MIQGYMVRVHRQFRKALCSAVKHGGETHFVVQIERGGEIMGDGASAQAAWKDAWESRAQFRQKLAA